MPMLKGTYAKRNFSPLVYSLVFEPTTSGGYHRGYKHYD